VSQATALSCAHCGAPGVTTPGAIVHVCRFCGRETPVPAGPSAALGAPVAIADFRGLGAMGFAFDQREPPPDGERLDSLLTRGVRCTLH